MKILFILPAVRRPNRQIDRIDPALNPLLAQNQVQLIQSAIRGHSPDPEKVHLSDFDIQFAENGKSSQMTCPAGQKVGVHTTHQQKGYVACFDLTLCQECPL